jgi:type IX secretion system PorP/SprF family membrane protein
LLYHNHTDMSTIKKRSMRPIYIQIILLLTILGTNTANAQLTEFQSMYFQNQYITNPAMAGFEKGLNFNIGYQRPWDQVPGNPVIMNATVDYNSGDRIGLGLKASSDKAGLINRTRILGTYAYHLPISGKDQKLNFGLSLGVNFANLNYDKIVGDQVDPALQNFNEGGTLDGDFGISYTSQLLNIQAALPNLNSLLFEKDSYVKKYADIPIFYSAISYKIYLSNRENDFTIEPMFAYRGIKGYKDIIDVGARFNMPENHINLSVFYHSNEVFSTSLGVALDQLGFFLSYSNYVGNTGAYANNTFELGISYRFLN